LWARTRRGDLPDVWRARQQIVARDGGGRHGARLCADAEGVKVRRAGSLGPLTPLCFGSRREEGEAAETPLARAGTAVPPQEPHQRGA
jgi:hypothetical protein